MVEVYLKYIFASDYLHKFKIQRKRKMSKILLVISFVSLITFAAACGGNSGDADADSRRAG